MIEETLDDETLRSYAEEVKKRVGEEKEKSAEEKFLRSSLKGSTRLKAIENYRKLVRQGAVVTKTEFNEAFESDESPVSSRSELLELISYLRTKIQTVESNEDGELDDADQWEWLLTVLSDPSLSKAFLMHDCVAAAYEKCSRALHPTPRARWPVLPGSAYDVLEAVQKQLLALQQQRVQLDVQTLNLATNLHSLLASPKLRYLLLAMDGLANTWLFEADEERDEDDSDVVESGDFAESLDDPTIEPSVVPGCYAKLAFDEDGRDSYSERGVRLKYVVFQKRENEFLGATVRVERRSILVARIVNGGLAQKTNLLHEGDELLAANGIELLGKDLNTVTEILASLHGQLVLLVAPASDAPPEGSAFGVIHLRALFSYDPDEDRQIACRDLGLPFSKGDILHVTDQRDPDWWQAYRNDEETGITGAVGTLAGLIPSPLFQRRRAILRLRSLCNTSPKEVEWEKEPSDMEASDEVGQPDSLTHLSSEDKTMRFLGVRLSFRKSKPTKQVHAKVPPTCMEYSDADELDSADSSACLFNSGLVGELYANRLSTISNKSYLQPTEGAIEEWSAAGPVWGQHGYDMRSRRRHSPRKSERKTLSSCLQKLKGEKRSRHVKKPFLSLNPVPSVTSDTSDPVAWLDKEVATGYLPHPSLWTYEPVTQYFPQPLRRRPLVFIGPAHVGRHQLMQRLIQSDPDRFCSAPIYTTNSKIKSDSSTSYICVSEEAFEADRKRGEYIEWGVFSRARYGTSRTSVRQLVEEGKVCCITLRPDSLRVIRASGLMAYVIFISPPERVDELRNIQKQLGLQVNCTDFELLSCIEASRKMELRFGHWFDIAIVPESMDSTVAELALIATRLERTHSWIPRYWA